MCGIAGYFNKDPQKELLLRMISQIEHRGPDGFGYYLDRDAGLAHARLSIIDLKGGAQPISNEDETIWVTFNGEIYNYLELRTILEKRGHVFKTKTDTEVIVHAYEEYGVDCIPMFNGQFAFALWDSNTQNALLARDRVGIQPLFYTDQWLGSAAIRERTLYFASEIKALMANPELRQGLNPTEIANTFTYWSPSSGRSVFKGVKEVPPGCYLTFVQGKYVEIRRYWQHDFTKRDSVFGLVHHMENAVDFRLRADVPVAAYLSGGLDSSIIATLAKKKLGGELLSTFSIEFEDAAFDESEYQRKMVSMLGTGHTVHRCTKEEIADVFPKVVMHAEKPLFRTAPAPMYLLSKRVRDSGFKVVLTGEGADEVFGGYDIFRELVVRQMMLSGKYEAAYINRLLQQLYPWMSHRALTSSTDYMKVFFGGSRHDQQWPWFSHEPRIKSSSKSHAFFADHMHPTNESSYFRTIGGWPDCDDFEQAQFLEWMTLFNGYLMSSQGDRMLMANGVEGRFPFLDPHVVDFGNSLPWTSKVYIDEAGMMDEKHILKQYAQIHKWVPSIISERKKQPYMAPDAECFMGPDLMVILPYVEHLMSPDADYGYFNMKKVRLLCKKVRAGKAKGFADNQAFIGILSTQLLHWQMVESFVPIKTADESRFKVAVEKLY